MAETDEHSADESHNDKKVDVDAWLDALTADDDDKASTDPFEDEG